MIIPRQETWGKLMYDTKNHCFAYTHDGETEEQPYVSKPIVLNIDLTLNCNMECYHCVAKDMRNYIDEDLAVNEKMIEHINRSPFMIIVITGGEPLLPDYERPLLQLLQGIKEKGLIIDTNGSIFPSANILNMLHRKNVLVRVSLDSIRVQDELLLRHFPGSKNVNVDVFKKKLQLISNLRSYGIKVAVQSVLHKLNQVSIKRIPEKLKEWSVNQWYIHRLIPSSNISKEERFFLQTNEYETLLDKLEQICRPLGIQCFTKKDRRHNCVFLLVGDGQLYTQSEKVGSKLFVGRIDTIHDYFQYVSASDHSARYYKIQTEKRLAERNVKSRARRRS